MTDTKPADTGRAVNPGSQKKRTPKTAPADRLHAASKKLDRDLLPLISGFKELEEAAKALRQRILDKYVELEALPEG